MLLAMLAGSACMADAGVLKTRVRAVQLSDVFRLESLGQHYGGAVSFSPDGGSLAFTRVRAQETALDVGRELLSGNERADVWLLRPEDSEPENLTKGLQDGTGWWAPSWSQDGRYL